MIGKTDKLTSHGAAVLAAFFGLGSAVGAFAQGAPASTERFPDWSGQWTSGDAPPPESVATPPLLADEYAAVWENHRMLLEAGIPAGDPTAKCLPPGMPRVMLMGTALEIIIKPGITYIYAEWDSQLRRIYTDGRDFPDYIPASFNGYSIGEWEDSDNDGAYDLLTIETRGFSGPRALDATGLLLHENNQTVVHESLRLIDDDMLENRITTHDDALKEPWTTVQRYQRHTENIMWRPHLCVNGPRYFELGDYWYVYHPSTDLPEPANSDQPPLVFEETE